MTYSFDKPTYYALLYEVPSIERPRYVITYISLYQSGNYNQNPHIVLKGAENKISGEVRKNVINNVKIEY